MWIQIFFVAKLFCCHWRFFVAKSILLQFTCILPGKIEPKIVPVEKKDKYQEWWQLGWRQRKSLKEPHWEVGKALFARVTLQGSSGKRKEKEDLMWKSPRFQLWNSAIDGEACIDTWHMAMGNLQIRTSSSPISWISSSFFRSSCWQSPSYMIPTAPASALSPKKTGKHTIQEANTLYTG